MLGAIGGQVGMTYLSGFIGWHKILLLGPIIGLILCVLMFFFIKDGSKPAQKNIDTSLKQFIKNLGVILSDGQIWLIGLIGSLLYLSLSVFAEIWGKSYLMVAHNLSSLEASSSVSMVFLGWAIGGPLLGLTADYTDRRSTALILGAILAAISISILLYMPELNILEINALLFFYGLFCAVEVIVFSIAKDTSKSPLDGTIFACVNMVIMMGGVIFQPLVGELLDYFWNGNLLNHVRIYSEADYQLVLSFLPLSLIFVAIAVFFVRDINSK
jgi:MFS family permease